MLQVFDFLLREGPNHHSRNKARCIIVTIDQLIVIAKGCTESCLRSGLGSVVALWEEYCVVVLFVTKKELQSKSISE